MIRIIKSQERKFLMLTLNETLKDIRHRVDDMLDKLLPLPGGPEKQVVEAMRYATIGGGKALRPFLLVMTANMFGIPKENSIRLATALEMLHSYSLIHDDLPCMDNDDLRRGKPSCHKKFGEATAILAGNGLLIRAFEIMASEKTWIDPVVRCELIVSLANAAGFHGMIGGQMLDLLAQKDEVNMSLTEIVRLETMKTGRLLMFACDAGAILGNASFDERQCLKLYASNLGQAFQLTDDILDIEGAVEKVGKTLRKDVKANKATYVSLVGVDNAKLKAKELTQQAINALTPFGDKTLPLKELALFILTRDH